MRALVAVASVIVALTSGCGGAAPTTTGVTVVAAFAPLHEAVERVAGDAASVVDATPAGAEPHDVELDPGTVQVIDGAALVVYVRGGFQPALEDAVDRTAAPAFDAATVVPSGDDPHVWLDPRNLAAIADVVAVRLGDVVPAERDAFSQRATELKAELEQLHAELEDGLRDCDRRDIVVTHAAFGHLASAYDLEQHALVGFEPEAEPDPRALGEVARLIQATGTTTVFAEPLVSTEVVDAVARETGAEVAILDPIEVSGEGTYAERMRRNLDVLRTALGCR